MAIATPAIFNPASLRVFEPEKIAFVRSVALLMLALWSIEAFSNRRSPLPVGEGPGVGSVPLSTSPHIPFLAPVAALMGCYLLAALLSDLPQVSLAGSYRRQFGALTHLSYAAVFLVVATHLRTRWQATRLLLAIVLGTFFPCTYALAQKLGLDPLPWSIDQSRRVVGTLGQPTFLGAYLAAALPASVWLLMRASSRIPRIGLVAILILQTAALLFSQSRAAWLGTLIGVSVVALSSAWARRAFHSLGIRGSIAGLLIAIGLLVSLNLPDTKINRLARSVPYLERAASFADFGSGSGQVRTLIWQTVPALVAERPLVGRGPEMMGYAFERHYPPGLAYAESRTASADEAHNVLLQQLVTAGVFGLASYLWLIVSVVRVLILTIYQGMRGKENSSVQGVRGLAAPALGGILAGLAEGMAGVPSPRTIAASKHASPRSS